jgi:hypothetical protein
MPGGVLASHVPTLKQLTQPLRTRSSDCGGQVACKPSHSIIGVDYQLPIIKSCHID